MRPNSSNFFLPASLLHWLEERAGERGRVFFLQLCCGGFDRFVGSRALLGGPFGFEGFEVGAGDVAAEGVHKISFGVAFGVEVVDPEGAGFDALGFELLGQPDVSDRFAVAGFEPGAADEGVQPGDQVAGEDALFGALQQDAKNIQQE